MTNQHPITPPPELVQQWEEDWHHSKVKHIELKPYIAAQSAQYGADQELEACCEWLEEMGLAGNGDLELLRADRRPKTPSLKEQAHDAYWALRHNPNEDQNANQNWDTIRRALEQLDD